MYNTEAPHKISYGSVYHDCKNYYLAACGLDRKISNRFFCHKSIESHSLLFCCVAKDTLKENYKGSEHFGWNKKSSVIGYCNTASLLSPPGNTNPASIAGGGGRAGGPGERRGFMGRQGLVNQNRRSKAGLFYRFSGRDRRTNVSPCGGAGV